MKLNKDLDLVTDYVSELDSLSVGVNIVPYVKAQRLTWFGHIQRMEDDRKVKKLTNWNPSGKD